MTGTVRTEKAGYLTFRRIRLRNGMLNRIHHENINILSHQGDSSDDYEYDGEDPSEKTVDSMGRVRTVFIDFCLSFNSEHVVKTWKISS